MFHDHDLVQFFSEPSRFSDINDMPTTFGSRFK